MYIKGASRRSVGFWAKHLQDREQNLRAEIIEARGLVAEDLKDMMLEMREDTRLTRCKNFMYIASFNPCPHEHLTEQQWEQAYEIFEKHRGIPAGQQRIVIEHEKEGRIHRHVVWNRVDLETMRAFRDAWSSEVCAEAKQEIERELNLERTPLLRGREKGAAKPVKSFEMYRGMKSGIDPREVTAEVTQIFRQSHNGADFVEGLRQHGYQLADGRRGLCILDAAGHEHSLVRRIEGVRAKELRAFMEGVDLGELPTVEQARLHYRDRKIAALEADRETVHNEIEWLEALTKAAIEKEKIELRFLEPEIGTPKGRGHREKIGEQGRGREKPAAPELGTTAGEIRLAYILTHSGQGFANALEDRGLLLAQVTEAEVDRLNRWERQRLKERKELEDALEKAAAMEGLGQGEQSAKAKAPARPLPEGKWFEQTGGIDKLTPAMREKAEAGYARWKHNGRYEFADYVAFVQKHAAEKREAELAKGPGQEKPYEKYKTGDLVVVDRWGNIHALNYRNTGDTYQTRQQHLKDIDRASLLDVGTAQNVMHDVRREQREEKGQVWEQQRAEKYWPSIPHQAERKQWTEFARAAAETGNDGRVQNLHGPAAELWEAWRRVDEARHARKFRDLDEKKTSFSVGTDKKAFAAELDEKGIAFARATKEEAQESQKLADFAKAAGNTAPRFKEGEIVIVTEPGLERWRNGGPERSRRLYKIDPSLAAKFVDAAGLTGKLQSIEATLKASDERARQRASDWEAIRFERAASKKRGKRPIPAKAITKAVLQGPLSLAKTPIIAPTAALNVVGKPLEMLGEMFEGLFAPKLTRAQKLEGDFARREREGIAEDKKQETERAHELAAIRTQQQREALQEKPERPRELDRDR